MSFIVETLPIEKIVKKLEDITQVETQFKKELEIILEDKTHIYELTDEIKKSFQLYLAKPLQYFDYVNYNDKELELLFTALNNYIITLSSIHFKLKKNLLEYQASLLTTENKL